MRHLFPLLVLLVLASFGVAQAQFREPTGLVIYNVWVRPTAAAPADGATPEPPLPGTVTSAYMTIENRADEDYQLVSIEADFDEMSMIHETTLDDAGVARMRMVGALDIPTGETVQLAPAGYHAMMMNLTSDLYPGEAVALTLTFADNDGETLSMRVGALVTDLPPDDDSMIAINPEAQFLDDGSLGVSMILYNRTEPDRIMEATTSLGGDVAMIDANVGISNPINALPIPPLIYVFFPWDALKFHLPNITEAPGEAFTMTMTFQTSRTLTFAVPIMTEEAE